MRGRRDARQCRRRLAGREARQEGSASRRRGRSPMDVKRYFRGPFVAVIVVLLLFFFLYRYANSGPTYKSENTSRVIQLIETGQVRSAILTDTNQTIQVVTKNGQQLQADWVGNQGQEIAGILQQQYQKSILFSFLPYIAIIFVFLLFLNQMQGGGSRVMNFGKSKAKLITKDTPKTTFADVAGADEAIEELQEIKEFLQAPGKFQAIGAKIPKGVLL